MSKAIRDYNDPYKYSIDVDGEVIDFGFDGMRELVLFGGSFCVKFPQVVTLAEVEQDLKENYDRYKEEDLIATYEAWGYYD